MIPPFRRIRTADPDLDRVQDSLAQTLDPVVKAALLNNVLVSNMPGTAVGTTVQLNIGTSFQNVAHTLGRTPIGWLVVRRDADANVWETAIGNPDATKFLRLRATVAVNVTLLVF